MTVNRSVRRSPFFYVGDKYKLISQLLNFFPSKIRSFYEPFVGGGSVFLNVNAEEYHLNDIDPNIISIHAALLEKAQSPEIFFSEILKIIDFYNLSRSYSVDIVPSRLKKKWPKTYFAQFNKKGYLKMRHDFNAADTRDPITMYLLLIYGFNRMLRFNGKGKFNLPVGNVDFNENVVSALKAYFSTTRNRKTNLSVSDFRDFLARDFQAGDFVYVDPPYLISSSEYNKHWDSRSEKDLLNVLSDLDRRGIRFALSNVTRYRGRENDILLSWSKGYRVQPIQSNYISYHDNSTKQIEEVLITNYEPDR